MICYPQNLVHLKDKTRAGSRLFSFLQFGGTGSRLDFNDAHRADETTSSSVERFAQTVEIFALILTSRKLYKMKISFTKMQNSTNYFSDT